MSWLDSLKKQVLDHISGTPDAETPADPNAQAGVFDHAMDLLKGQGLGDLMKHFDAKGLKDVFSSWVSKGSNLPISADKLKEVLGGDKIKDMAVKLGLPEEQVSAVLSKILPGMVDHLTPDGTITEPPAEEGDTTADAGSSGSASF